MGTCHVFKVGLCIKCPGDVFRNRKEQIATQEDANKFYRCCIMGQEKYEKDDGSLASCHTVFRSTNEGPPGAFTEINSASATLKASYQCWDGDESDEEGKIAKEGADTVILVS